MNFHHLRMLCVKSGWNWLSGSWELDENVKSLLRDLHTDGGQYTIRKARATSVTSKGVKCFKTHNTCYTDLPTDRERLIYEIINPISYRKKLIPQNIYFACVDQIDRPTHRQADRHVQCDLYLIQKRDISTCISVWYIREFIKKFVDYL